MLTYRYSAEEETLIFGIVITQNFVDLCAVYSHIVYKYCNIGDDLQIWITILCIVFETRHIEKWVLKNYRFLFQMLQVIFIKKHL
jgi:hypothetical protein